MEFRSVHTTMNHIAIRFVNTKAHTYKKGRREVKLELERLRSFQKFNRCMVDLIGRSIAVWLRISFSPVTLIFSAKDLCRGVPSTNSRPQMS